MAKEPKPESQTHTGAQAMEPESFQKRKGTARLRADSDSASFRRSITLQLEADRSPKWETVTEKNRELWREIFSHPKTVEALELSPPSAGVAPGPAIPEAAVSAVYNGLARFEALICSQLFKVPYQKALEILAFTEEEKAQLVPVTQALAEKYIPVMAEAYGMEIGLVVLLFSITAGKMQPLRALAPKGETPAVEGEKVFEPRQEAIQ